MAPMLPHAAEVDRPQYQWSPRADNEVEVDPLDADLEINMDKLTQEFIQRIIDEGRDLTLATIRADGFPQATTVSYANNGLIIYVGIGKDSQKANNIRGCNKVSLTINSDYVDWDDIKGISMGALAEFLTDPEEMQRAIDLMIKRHPHVAQWANSKELGDIVLLKITPQVISVLDYNQGFGHTELVTP